MRGPTRATINYAVDIVIAAAFVASAVSGLVFLLPTGWVSTGGGTPRLLWVALATWRTWHEWSSLVLLGGVVLHTVLHWRWVVAMTKKTFAAPRSARSRQAGRPVDRSRIGPAPGGAHEAPANTLGPEAPGAMLAREAPAAMLASPAPTVVLTRYESETAVAACRETGGETDGPVGSGRSGPRRTRREVLAGLGMVGAAVVTGGLAGRVLADRLLERSASAEDAGSSGRGAVANDGEGASTLSGEGVSGAVDGTSVDGSSGEAPSSSSALTADRVVIDEGRCNGCGYCLPSCPYGVFAWGGSTAVVADANACRLCGRCLQACPTTAITLNA